MGVFCQSCNSFLNNEESEPIPDSNKQMGHLLPKQVVGGDITNDEEIKEENNEDKIVNINKKIKIENQSKTQIIVEGYNIIEEVNDEIPKSKTFLKETESQKNETEQEKEEPIFKRSAKRFNSFKSSKKLDIFDIVSEKNDKNNNNQDEMGKKNEENNKKFIRKKRNSAINIRNLFLVQMKVPLSQDLLVLEQKENPSDKYIRGRKNRRWNLWNCI